MICGVGIGAGTCTAVLEEGVSVDLKFDDFAQESLKGLDKDCFAGIRDLIRMTRGVSIVAVLSLVAMLHALMCIGKTFKCTLSTM